MAVLHVLLVLQGWTWSVTPAHPTVGDTVWLTASIALDQGWRLRAGRIETGGDVEPLADPAVYREDGSWVVRYPVVAWAPGNHQVALPPAWRLGPDGRADSIPGGSVSFTIEAVIPDSVPRPVPQPALVPLRRSESQAWPVVLALLGGAAGMLGLMKLRRRSPRRLELPLEAPVEPEPAEDRWLAAGEPRAVAARAASRLRGAIAAAIPEAHLGLSHPECLAVIGRTSPGAPVRELTVILAGLELAAFSGASSAEVGALARRAHALVQGGVLRQ